MKNIRLSMAAPHTAPAVTHSMPAMGNGRCSRSVQSRTMPYAMSTGHTLSVAAATV